MYTFRFVHCIMFHNVIYFAHLDIPETRVRLGSSLDPEAIREGTDVYFDCLVSAHPHVYKVEWRHNVNIALVNY